MATRFHLPSSGAAEVSPAFQSYSHAMTVRRRLPITDSTALTTDTLAPDGADHLVAGDVGVAQFVSAALGVQTFSSGAAFKFAIQALEANAGNNLQVQIFIGIVSNDGNTPRATIRSKVLEGVEVNTALRNVFFSSTLSGSYTTVAGDRLVVEFSLSGTPTAAGGVQGHNGSLRFGNNGAGGDLPENDTETGTTFNPWLEFAATVVWAPVEGATIASGNQRFAPTAKYAVTTAMIASGNTRFAPTVAVGAVAVTSSTIASGNQRFAPTVVPTAPGSSPPSMMTRSNRITRTRRLI